LKKTFDDWNKQALELSETWEIEFDKGFDPYEHWQGDKWVTDKIKSFISSLLAKQQEEFVKCIPEEKPLLVKDEEAEATTNELIMAYNECIADIKSKLKKEEPAYIGGVNLTTNDNEISSRLAVTDRNIGMLRQWLNEEKIDDFKKMITNDDIKFWLDIK
jgi:hypothetical protein